MRRAVRAGRTRRGRSSRRHTTWFPSTMAETRMVPAIAVPNDEPRLETLRERPEISPCISSGKLDWTTFTEGVSIAPTPSPNRNSPSRNATARCRGVHERDHEHQADDCRENPAAISVRWGYRAARLRAANEVIRMPAVADGEDQPGPDRAVSVHLLQVDGDDERRPHHDQPLQVLRDHREVADPVSE